MTFSRPTRRSRGAARAACLAAAPIAVALATWSAPARAADYALSLSGQGHGVPDSSFCALGDPACQEYDFTWTGTLDIATVGSGDGVYSGTDLQSVVLTANHGGFDWAPAADPFGGFTVTVANGQIASISGGWQDAQAVEVYHFADMHATYSVGADCSTCSGYETASGVLAPVPEPATWALMVVGLAAVAGLGRRRAR